MKAGEDPIPTVRPGESPGKLQIGNRMAQECNSLVGPGREVGGRLTGMGSGASTYKQWLDSMVSADDRIGWSTLQAG